MLEHLGLASRQTRTLDAIRLPLRTLDCPICNLWIDNTGHRQTLLGRPIVDGIGTIKRRRPRASAHTDLDVADRLRHGSAKEPGTELAQVRFGFTRLRQPAPQYGDPNHAFRLDRDPKRPSELVPQLLQALGPGITVQAPTRVTRLTVLQQRLTPQLRPDTAHHLLKHHRVEVPRDGLDEPGQRLGSQCPPRVRPLPALFTSITPHTHSPATPLCPVKRDEDMVLSHGTTAGHTVIGKFTTNIARQG